MDIMQLRYFSAVARYRNMTKAAEVLHVAQPAVSQTIKKLEDELGVSLFERTGRGVRMNETGEALLTKATKVIKAFDEIPLVVATAAGIEDKTIDVNILSASELITGLVIRYKEKHPEVNFFLSQNVNNRDWDVRVSTANPEDGNSSIHTALKEEIFLAVPKNSPFAERKSIKLKDVRDEQFISLEKNKPIYIITERYCLSAGFEPKVMFESDSPSTVRDLIGSGMGLAFWPAYSWGDIAGDKVKLMHISEPKCVRELFVAKKEEANKSPLKNDFYNFIVEHLQAAETGLE